jgi:hypothetical protein
VATATRGRQVVHTAATAANALATIAFLVASAGIAAAVKITCISIRSVTRFAVARFVNTRHAIAFVVAVCTSGSATH